MTRDPRVVGADESIRNVAQILSDEEIGAVIVQDREDLQGLITDRDIATQVAAKGMDVDVTRAGDLLFSGDVITVGPDEPIETAIESMKQHAVRRLPVVDGSELVGIVSQGDIAAHVPGARVGGMVEAISLAPANTGRG
jgi:CBS domain-containing protein